jgi:rhamnose transport system permease protein
MSHSWKRALATLFPWCLLACGIILVATQVERPGALVHLGVQKARIGALAAVMTAIILTGGIDLSVGSMVALSSVVMGVVWNAGVPAEVAALTAIAAGFTAGATNGVLVVIGLSPLVATLATMAFYSGLAMLLSGARKITEFPETWLDACTFGGVPNEYWLLLATFVVAIVIVHGTRFGNWCYAIGDNPIAARFAAVPVNWTQWWLYAASGLVAGFLAVVYTMRQGANPTAHQGLELQVIACVVVGGTLITGGRGSIPRTLLGLAVISSLDIGLSFLSFKVEFLTADARLMVIGALLVLVAVGNEWLARSRE